MVKNTLTLRRTFKPEGIWNIIPATGTLRTWHKASRSLSTSLTLVEVQTPKDALVVLSQLAKNDLQDDTVDWNAQGLEVWTGTNWEEWEDEAGRQIDDLADDIEFIIGVDPPEALEGKL